MQCRYLILQQGLFFFLGCYVETVFVFASFRGVKWSNRATGASRFLTRFLVWHFLEYLCVVTAEDFSGVFSRGENKRSLVCLRKCLCISDATHRRRHNSNKSDEENYMKKTQDCKIFLAVSEIIPGKTWTKTLVFLGKRYKPFYSLNWKLTPRPTFICLNDSFLRL